MLRVVFAASASLGVYWASGLISDVLFGFEVSTRYLTLLLVAGLLAIVVIPIIWPRGFLAPARQTSWGRFCVVLMVATILGYFLLIPLSALLGWILASATSMATTPNAEDDTLVVLIAIWLPLWWAPGAGCLITWFLHREKKSARVAQV